MNPIETKVKAKTAHGQYTVQQKLCQLDLDPDPSFQRQKGPAVRGDSDSLGEVAHPADGGNYHFPSLKLVIRINPEVGSQDIT